MSLKNDLMWLEEQPTNGGCVFCPRIVFHGTAREVWEAQAEHRRKKHPETFKRRTKRSSRHLARWQNSGMKADEEAEVMEEVRRRAFLNGVEL